MRDSGVSDRILSNWDCLSVSIVSIPHDEAGRALLMDLPIVWCSTLKPFTRKRALMILCDVPVLWLEGVKGVGRLDLNDEDIGTGEDVVCCYIKYFQGPSEDLLSTKLALRQSISWCRACSSPCARCKR